MNFTHFQLTIANLVVSVALLLVVGGLVLFITLFKSQPEEPGKIKINKCRGRVPSIACAKFANDNQR